MEWEAMAYAALGVIRHQSGRIRKGDLSLPISNGPPPSDLFIQCESFKRLPLRKLQSGLGRPWPIMKISVLSGLPVPSNSWMERSSWPIMPGRAHRCVTDRMATDRARDSALEILNTNFKSSINVLRHKNPKPAHTSIAALQSFPWLIVTVATDRP